MYALALLARPQQPSFISIAWDSKLKVLSLQSSTEDWINLWLEIGDGRDGMYVERNGQPSAYAKELWSYFHD